MPKTRTSSTPSDLPQCLDEIINQLEPISTGDFHFVVKVPEGDERLGKLVALLNIAVTAAQYGLDRILLYQTRLAAAISHELNSPLAVTQSTAEMLAALSARRDEPPSADEEADLQAKVEELTRTMGQAMERVEQVIARLHRFTNLDGAGVQLVNPNELLSDVVVMAGLRLKGKLEIDLDQEIPQINCHPSELSMVLVTLLDNALEAITPDGSVTLKSSRREKVWEIEIRDDGSGSSKQNNWLYFLARRIIQQHHGEINFHRAPGEGTSVILTLPLENGLGRQRQLKRPAVPH